MIAHVSDQDIMPLVEQYVRRLALPTDCLYLTDDRRTFAGWLGRTIPGAYGGAYSHDRRRDRHLVLINVARIDRTKPRSVEIVVCEELVHMRDALDGDHRRHRHHGHDRIAHRVANLTGASLAEIRECLIPVRRRPLRYRYRCPICGAEITRRRRGTWSCGRCSSVFDRRFVLRLIADDGPAATSPR